MRPGALTLGEVGLATTPADNSLPKSWSVAPLGALGRWIGGGTPSKSMPSYWTGGDVPWVSPKDMKSAIITDTQDHITEAAVAESAANFVPPDSVLMVMRSGILRHSFPVAVNAVRVTVNQDLRALVPADAIDPQYLANYLRSIERQVLHECAKDGTTVQSIEASALDRIIVPIAPADEQRRIVARIDELFAEIAEGEAALERVRQLSRGQLPSASAGGLVVSLRQSILKAAFEGRLVPQDQAEEPASALLARLRDRPGAAAPSGRRRRRGERAPLTPLLPGLTGGGEGRQVPSQ